MRGSYGNNRILGYAMLFTRVRASAVFDGDAGGKIDGIIDLEGGQRSRHGCL
jgi:hypothetical protein